MIDLGLSCKSNDIETKAVDLYVMERALLSTHPNSEKFVSFSKTKKIYFFEE